MGYFRLTMLLNLEAEDKSYRATCSICEASAVDTDHASQQTVRCKVCQKAQPLHAFRPSKHNRDDWACLKCEFPTCSSSGCSAKPDKPQSSVEWTCSNCRYNRRYPPCITCSQKRPRYNNGKEISLETMPTWRCAKCRASSEPLCE